MAGASARNVDFSNVKDGGAFNRSRIPAGDYLATITKVEDAESKSDGVFQYLFSIKINKKPSSVFPFYCKLQENQLWKLRNLMIAAGITVPKRRMKVDPNRLVGKVIGVTVEDDEYEGKEQSTVQGVFPASELSDGYGEDPNSDDEDEPETAMDDEDNLDDLQDEEPEDEPEEDDEPADPYGDMDRAALKAELKKRDSSFQARKSQTDDDLRALLRESDGGADEDDEEEDEEPTPPPAKKKAAPARRARKKTAAPKADEVTDEELDELDIDDL